MLNVWLPSEVQVQAWSSGRYDREVTSTLLDLHLSSLSTRMNEIMKVLTIIATIFIPLTFVAGIYGMNFEFMPELNVRWAYPVTLGVMAVIALGMLFFFRRRKWL